MITYAAAYSSVAGAVILCEIKLKVAAPVQASTNARDKYVSHLRVDDHAGETRFFFVRVRVACGRYIHFEYFDFFFSARTDIV